MKIVIFKDDVKFKIVVGLAFKSSQQSSPILIFDLTFTEISYKLTVTLQWFSNGSRCAQKISVSVPAFGKP